MKIEKYLQRINTAYLNCEDFEYLKRLHENHLLSIPFENMDVRLGAELKLDFEHLYNKIVVHNRGGLCFELNYLFSWLLASLGYRVRIAAASVFDPKIGEFENGFDHMVLLVQLSHTYLVDVGFGDCFRIPIALTGDPIEDISGTYRIRKMQSEEAFYCLQKHNHNMWNNVYKFTTQRRGISDFHQYLKHVTTSPQSYHANHTLCSIATTSGRVTLTDFNLTITENRNKKKTEIDTDEEFENLLNHHFNVKIEGLSKSFPRTSNDFK